MEVFFACGDHSNKRPGAVKNQIRRIVFFQPFIFRTVFKTVFNGKPAAVVLYQHPAVQIVFPRHPYIIPFHIDYHAYHEFFIGPMKS